MSANSRSEILAVCNFAERRFWITSGLPTFHQQFCLYADHAIILAIWPAYCRIGPAQLTSALERKS
jgi:hypothetical protein